MQTSPRPICHDEARHALELAAVERHRCRATPPRLRGDEDIIGADGRSLRFEGGADVACFGGVVLVESMLLEAARQQRFQNGVIGGAPLPPGEPIFKFVPHDRRNHQRLPVTLPPRLNPV